MNLRQFKSRENCEKVVKNNRNGKMVGFTDFIVILPQLRINTTYAYTFMVCLCVLWRF